MKTFRRISFVCLGLFLLAAVGAVLTAAFLIRPYHPMLADEPLAGRIIDGKSAAGRIWLVGGIGPVKSLISLDHNLTHLASHYGRGVVAISDGEGGPWVLLVRDIPNWLFYRGGAFQVRVRVDRWNGDRFLPGAWVRLGKMEVPIGVVVDDGAPVVLTSNALYASSGAGWKRTALKGAVLRVGSGFHFDSQVTPRDDSVIYAGSNLGEWGGGIQRIDIATGIVTETGETSPVTGLAADRERSDCVLAAVGLRHFGEHGRVVRVCPDGMEVVLERKHKELSGTLVDEWSEAMSGIAVTDGEFWTSTYESTFTQELLPSDPASKSKSYLVREDRRRHVLYRLGAGQVARYQMPKPASANGLYVARPHPKVLVIATNIKGPLEKGRFKPLLIALD
ncbi:hypothetical protein [Emcibacter sp. SYSU 3D8]|uniref:hypothetical protein n=1 Tax=Emcibacter sp. SYSU 3D8 TaxID=3133969 RepID=UPI0031FECFD9